MRSEMTPGKYDISNGGQCLAEGKEERDCRPSGKTEVKEDAAEHQEPRSQMQPGCFLCYCVFNPIF